MRRHCYSSYAILWGLVLMQVEGQGMLRVDDKHLKFLHAGRRTRWRVLRVGREKFPENDLECKTASEGSPCKTH